MPRDPLLPDSTATVRPHSPDPSASSERKRRRKVLSCYDCRRRKLQCDRAMPACSRCTKAGQAANCLYIEDSVDTPTRQVDPSGPGNTEWSRVSTERPSSRSVQSHGLSGDVLARLEYQDRRIKQLEAALTSTTQVGATFQPKNSKLPLTPESVAAVDSATAPNNITDRETMLLRGKSFKTQFHGITYPGSLIAYIPELGAFTKETFEKYPALARIRQEMHALENRTDYAGSFPRSATEAEMRAMLPSKPVTDHLVYLYHENYGSIYHIMHLPTFQQEYNEMWSDLSATRPHFIAIVLLMTAASQCLESSEPWLYNANSSTAREKAIATISLVEHWLQWQSQKHVTVADFQIRFLLLLAKFVNASKFKRTWTEAGNVLRFFMAAGLHRNPDLLRKPTSALDIELRRRLWAAASEFELQESFARGMISAPCPQQSDAPPPINIHDTDIDQASARLPTSRPHDEFTNTSYLSMSAGTFHLRHTLNTTLNNIRQNIPFDEAKKYTDEIEMHLQVIPKWIGTTSGPPQTLMSNNLRQYLLVLHDRQFRQASSHSERNYSMMVLIDNATKILESHKALVARGCRALQFLCHDQLRVALSICHIVAIPNPQADSVFTDLVEQKAAQIFNDVIELVTDKITRYGREQRQLWIVLAANAFLKTKKSPSRKSEYMQEAVDKITRPYYKIMACQEDAPTAVSSGPPTGRSDLPNGVLEYLPNANPPKFGEYGPTDPTLLDFDEIAAWTLEDWSFNAGDFQSLGDVF